MNTDNQKARAEFLTLQRDAESLRQQIAESDADLNDPNLPNATRQVFFRLRAAQEKQLAALTRQLSRMARAAASLADAGAEQASRQHFAGGGKVTTPNSPTDAEGDNVNARLKTGEVVLTEQQAKQQERFNAEFGKMYTEDFGRTNISDPTGAFQDFFGNWRNDPANASKVVNEQGEPRRVFHGTRKDFQAFDPASIRKAGHAGRGFYFAESTGVSDAYTSDLEGEGLEGSSVIPAFLNIRKPFDFNANITPEEIAKLQEAAGGAFNAAALQGNTGFEIWQAINSALGEATNDAIEKAGFDGIVHGAADAWGSVEPPHNEPSYGRVWVAFHPEQIKSASGNRGTFDASQPEMHLATGGPVSGPGGPTADQVPAMLSDGEFVVNADAVKKIGEGNLEELNQQHFATGGPVHPAQAHLDLLESNASDIREEIVAQQRNLLNAPKGSGAAQTAKDIIALLTQEMRELALDIDKAKKAVQEYEEEEKRHTSAARTPFGTFEGTAARFGAGMNVSGAASAAALPFVETARGLQALQDAAMGAVNAVLPFVNAFNPGVVELFNLALENLMASVGAILQPIIEAAIPIANALNSLLTSIQAALAPAMQQLAQIVAVLGVGLADALKPVLDSLVPIFTSLVSALMPLLGPIVDLLDAFGQALAAINDLIRPLIEFAVPILVRAVAFVAQVLAGLARVIRDIANFLGGIFGFQLTNSQALNHGNITTAAQQPGFVGLEELARQAQLAAVRTGPNHIATIDTNVEAILGELRTGNTNARQAGVNPTTGRAPETFWEWLNTPTGPGWSF